MSRSSRTAKAERSASRGKSTQVRAELIEVCPDSRRAWRQWLAENHAISPGVWLIYYKRSTGRPSVTYDDVVEECLCFGWIDSTMRPIDAQRYKQLITPRKPGSTWSAVNKRRLDKLYAEGLMTPAGERVIAQAKLDGSWSLLDDAEALVMPADLVEALATFPNATANFDAFNRTAKRNILAWIGSAKRPETRATRIRQTAELAEQNQKSR